MKKTRKSRSLVAFLIVSGITLNSTTSWAGFYCCWTDSQASVVHYTTKCNEPYCDEPCQLITACRIKHCGGCLLPSAQCADIGAYADATVTSGYCALAGVDACDCVALPGAAPKFTYGLFDLSCH